MSDKALGLLFLNLGGEMLYVLDQRLYAQKIQVDKGKKIMQDIVSSMFSERFLDEIFKPQELCSRKALRTIFERLAHTSIMRLNESSMDKLFDLMTMAVKYQISLISNPRELILVTLNHLDSIIPFVSDSQSCTNLIELCYKRLFKSFSSMNDVEMQFIRYTMLNFLQDCKIKVSIFLKEKLQNWNGTFILYFEGPAAYEEPGTITYYENDGKTVYKESKFSTGAKYSPPEKSGVYDRHGDRVIKLGLNIYSSNKPVDTIVPTEKTNKTANVISDFETNVPDPKSRAQLDLLCKLIGKTSATNAGNTDFKLNLFNNEEEEFIYNTQVKQGSSVDEFSGKMLSFDASKRQRDERLNNVISDFSRSGRDYDDYDHKNRDRKGDNKPSQKHSNKSRNYEEDDDDDIVSMMDKLNRK